jgi:hypothetical protein
MDENMFKDFDWSKMGNDPEAILKMQEQIEKMQKEFQK